MQPRLEGRGAQQAAGDAGEDQGDVGGAELTAVDCGVVAEAALAQGGSEEGAVVDELADKAEQAADAAGFGGWGGWCAEHRRKEAQRGWHVKEYFHTRTF